ncbi:MAG: FecR family protein [Syntrophus sp. (in: bacteria)]
MNCHKLIFTLIILITIIICGGMAGVSLAVENRGHGAPTDALPKDLKNVSVKDYFLPGKTKEAGVVQTAIGHVVVASGNLSQAYFAINGDKLYEQDIVFTLKASKCRIKLLNNDVITLGAHTRITVKEVSGDRNAPEKKTNLSMARGQAMFYAIRTLSQKGAAMTVESPTSVAGVRGTKFGMEVTIEGEKTIGALPLLLADASDDWGRYLILAQASRIQRLPPTGPTGPTGPVGPTGQAGPTGPNITTTVHGFDGTVTVTSTVDGRTQSVGAGQTVSASPLGMGAIMPTPPQVSQRFQSETNVPPPGGGSSQSSGSNSGTGSGNAPSATTIIGGTGTPTTITVDTSNITQEQNVNKIEEQQQQPTTTATDPVTDPRTNASSSTSGNKVGYFASLLSNLTGGTFAGGFSSQYRYDSNSNMWARGPNDADYVRVLGNEGFNAAPTLKWVVFDSGTKNSGELSSAISSTTLGSNDNVEWGYATVPGSFTVGNTSYAIDNRTYWITGNNTPSLAVIPGSSATYSGGAGGTYWTAAGGINMSGTFSGDVNFTSAMLSNFNLDVSGSGASAYIHNASGYFASDASFTITPSSGTWNLNGVTPDRTTAIGSLYGSTGVVMGGVWGMYSTANNTAAVGIFGGSNIQKGHYAGMLEYVSGGSYSNTYLTTATQDFTSSNASAWSSAYSTQIDGTGSTKKMVQLNTSGGQWQAAPGAGLPVTFSKTSANSYMEWGTWTQATAMSDTMNSYDFRNQGAYVWGSATTDSEMATLKSNMITANYSGSAWGTYFVGNSAGTAMTGTFSGAVNFATPEVTGFNVNVSGGGKSVAITGAMGAFSTATGQTSTFTITPSSGNWKINGAPATDNGATGTVYGNGADKGKYVGGVWKTGFSMDHAVGGFQGSK